MWGMVSTTVDHMQLAGDCMEVLDCSFSLQDQHRPGQQDDSNCSLHETLSDAYPVRLLATVRPACMLQTKGVLLLCAAALKAELCQISTCSLLVAPSLGV
jgi:hypothetical protein